MRNLVASAFILALCAVPAWSHGGQYKGPSDAAGPNASSGGAVAPPTNPGGAAAPGPGAPSSGGATVTGAGTGSGQVRGKSARKATTGGGQIELGRGYDVWEFWWENNKDAFLNLKGRLTKTSNTSGSLGMLTGRGRKAESAGSSRRPSPTQIRQEVIPNLETLLRSETNRDIIDSAILALGRVAREESAEQVVQAAMPLLSHNELSVQTSSTLALGVLASTKATPVLKDLLADSSNGRQAVGGGQVNWLVRSFAALSLGLVDDPDAAATLVGVIDKLPDSDRDIKVCAIVGLGLMSAENLSNDDRAFLYAKLKDRKLDDVIKSYIPTTLGKLGDVEAVPTLVDVLSDRDTDLYVRQSAAIGLGRLASITDDEVIEALSDYIKEGRDVQTRHFSFISLAKIGARDEAPQDHAEAHEKIVSLFGREMTKPSKSKHEPWAGIGGALYARAHTGEQASMIERLKKAYEGTKDPSDKSAFAVALGLLNSKEMAPVLLDDFLSSKDQDLRGYLAIGLGLCNWTDAAEAMRGIVKNKTTTPTFRLQVATALGLMSDEQAVSTLIETLSTAETLGVSSAVAKALGLIGDKSAIPELQDIADDDDRNDITRAFACVALGIVGEKTDLPWNASISEDNNYRARVPAIDEVLDIL